MSTPVPIHRVKIGGKDRPVRYGHNALATFSRLTDTPLSGLQHVSSDTTRLDEFLALAWAGLKDGARKRGKDFDATVDDVGDWLDEADEDTAKQIFAAFQDAQSTPEEEEEEAGNAEEK